MSKVIICANQKGGVAKTTTTLNVGVGLAKECYYFFIAFSSTSCIKKELPGHFQLMFESKPKQFL